MNPEEKYPFLYYLSPPEYRRLYLDGESDPKSLEINDNLFKCSTKLAKVPLQDIVIFMVEVLKNKMPNMTSYRLSVLKGDGVDILNGTRKPNRDNQDIISINTLRKSYFEDKEKALVDLVIDGHTFSPNTRYIEQISVELKESRPELSKWIEIALDGKTYEKNNGAIIVQDSPILKVEIESKKFTIHLDKATYRTYF
jgi:hypothetical protein